MVYIRVKTINSQPYAYLVENISTAKGPRQKVKKYLGRVRSCTKAKEEETVIAADTKKNFLKHLIIKHLQNHGFAVNETYCILDNITFSLDNLQMNTGVLAMNDGFLCNYTIQQLLEFKKTRDLSRDAHTLAKSFLLAGLPLSREEFVSFYQLLK